MKTEELQQVIAKHQKWLDGREGGARADFRDCDLSGSDLRNSDLRYSNLRNSDLRYSNLRNSDLRNSDLRYSDLRNSDLRYSDLRNSDLRYSDLSNCDLSNCVGLLFITQRSDGYQFFAMYETGTATWMIRAGCQYRTIESYREHTKSYKCEKKRSETLLILDYAELIIKDRGITDADTKPI